MDQSPIDELKRLDEQVEHVADLPGLKPIFYRLEEISKQFSGDFDVQLVVADVKQHLVNKGMRLKEALDTGQPGYDTATVIPPLPPPPPPLGTGTGSRPTTPSTGNPFGTQQFGPGTSSNPTIAPPPPVEPGSSGFTPAPPTRGVGSGTDQIPAARTAMPLTTSQLSTPTATPPAPPKTPARPPTPPPKPGAPNWKRSVGIGAAIALVLFAGFVAIVGRRHKTPPVAATVPVDISTMPPGASVRVNNEIRCTSNCRLNLAPGNYTITALLDGYEPSASGVTVTAGSAPLPVSMTLQPQAQTVRVFADEPGKVTLDDQPPRDIQDGQLVLDGVKNGKHVVKVDTKSGGSTFSFEVVSGKPPVIEGPVNAKNMIAVLLSGSGGDAHLATNPAPLKVSLDGQPKGEAGPGGLDLTSVTPGDHQLAIGDGKDQKTLVVTFGPAPMLTAFLKSDINAGTLVIVAGVDDASVFLNGREQRMKTQHGQMRISYLGPATVRVAKSGFQEVSEQKVTVKKGDETRVEFTLKPLPRFASLHIRNANPGILVLVDDKNAGTVGPDGGFSQPNLAPGDHVVELRRDRFQTKRLTRSFKAGETVTLTGNDVILVSDLGTVHVTVTPPNATVVYRHADEPQTHDVKGSVQLDKGVYHFIARAPGYVDKEQQVVVMNGDARTLDFRLDPVKVAQPIKPVVHIGTMADWENPAQWTSEDGMYVHRGGGPVLFKPQSTGTYSFTVKLLKGGGAFKGNHVRWMVNYKDARDYAVFDLEKKNFTSKDVVNGKSTDVDKNQHEESESYNVVVQVEPGRVINRVQNSIMYDWQQAGRNFADGSFGFLVQGSEEIAIKDFKFTPAAR